MCARFAANCFAIAATRAEGVGRAMRAAQGRTIDLAANYETFPGTAAAIPALNAPSRHCGRSRPSTTTLLRLDELPIGDQSIDVDGLVEGHEAIELRLLVKTFGATLEISEVESAGLQCPGAMRQCAGKGSARQMIQGGVGPDGVVIRHAVNLLKA